MAKDQFRRRLSGMLCGCVIVDKTTWIDANGDGKLDTAIFDGPASIDTRCDRHADFATLETLNAELSHYTKVLYSPQLPGCACCVAFYIDDREPEDENGLTVQHPIESPGETRRCALHASLSDPVAHHAAVWSDAIAWTTIIRKVAAAVNLEPSSIPYTLVNGRPVVDAAALGLTEEQVATALAEG